MLFGFRHVPTFRKCPNCLKGFAHWPLKFQCLCMADDNFTWPDDSGICYVSLKSSTVSPQN